MKTTLLLILTLWGAQLVGLASPPAVPQRPELEGRIMSLFELDDSARFGSKKGDEMLLRTLSAKGDRDEIIRYVLDRAELMGLGVTIYYNGTLFFSWRDADAERRVVDVEIQVSLDERKPVSVVSSIKKGKPLPQPTTVPAEKTKIDVPPTRNEKQP